jgi:hypothetical protein
MGKIYAATVPSMNKENAGPASPLPASNFFAVYMNMKRRAVFKKLCFQRGKGIGLWFKKPVEYDVFRCIGRKMPQYCQENMSAFLFGFNITNVRA